MTETDQEKSQSPSKGRTKQSRIKQDNTLETKSVAKGGKAKVKAADKRRDDDDSDVINTSGPATKKQEEKPTRRGKSGSSTRIDATAAAASASTTAPKAAVSDKDGANSSQNQKESKPVQAFNNLVHGGKQVPVQVVSQPPQSNNPFSHPANPAFFHAGNP